MKKSIVTLVALWVFAFAVALVPVSADRGAKHACPTACCVETCACCTGGECTCADHDCACCAQGKCAHDKCTQKACEKACKKGEKK